MVRIDILAGVLTLPLLGGVLSGTSRGPQPGSDSVTKGTGGYAVEGTFGSVRGPCQALPNGGHRWRIGYEFRLVPREGTKEATTLDASDVFGSSVDQDGHALRVGTQYTIVLRVGREIVEQIKARPGHYQRLLLSSDDVVTIRKQESSR